MSITKNILVLILGLFTYTHAMAVELPKPMVEVEWLENHLEDVFILDVRDDLTSFRRSPKFVTNKDTNKKDLVRVGGHIPGASKLKYKKVRGTQIVDGKKIKFNLPEKTEFQKLLQQTGVNQDSKIVVVSNATSDIDLTMATRVYWQLKYFGHEEISLLNGGTAKWLIDGNKVETSKSSKPEGDWKVTAEREELLAGSEEVEAAIHDPDTLLVDVRPLAQASGGWFVLHELLGNKNVKLYDGSMHQWTAENRQVVTMKME